MKLIATGSVGTGPPSDSEYLPGNLASQLDAQAVAFLGQVACQEADDVSWRFFAQEAWYTPTLLAHREDLARAIYDVCGPQMMAIGVLSHEIGDGVLVIEQLAKQTSYEDARHFLENLG